MKLALAFSSRPPYGPVPPGVFSPHVCPAAGRGQSCWPQLGDDNWEPGIQGGGHTVPCIQQQCWLKHIPGCFIPPCVLLGERELCGERRPSPSGTTNLLPPPAFPALLQSLCHHRLPLLLSN